MKQTDRDSMPITHHNCTEDTSLSLLLETITKNTLFIPSQLHSELQLNKEKKRSIPLHFVLFFPSFFCEIYEGNANCMHNILF